MPVREVSGVLCGESDSCAVWFEWHPPAQRFESPMPADHDTGIVFDWRPGRPPVFRETSDAETLRQHFCA